jgi:hypothetical protein
VPESPNPNIGITTDQYSTAPNNLEYNPAEDRPLMDQNENNSHGSHNDNEEREEPRQLTPFF